MNDNRKQRLSDALRANLKRRKQQVRGRAGQAEPDRDAPQEPKPEADADAGSAVGSEDKQR